MSALTRFADGSSQHGRKSREPTYRDGQVVIRSPKTQHVRTVVPICCLYLVEVSRPDRSTSRGEENVDLAFGVLFRLSKLIRRTPGGKSTRVVFSSSRHLPNCIALFFRPSGRPSSRCLLTSLPSPSVVVFV